MKFQSHFSIVQKLSILAPTACGHHPFVFAFIGNVSLLHFMSLSPFSSPQWGQSFYKGAISTHDSGIIFWIILGQIQKQVVVPQTTDDQGTLCSSKSQLLGLGRQFGQINFGAFSVIFFFEIFG